MIGLGCFEFNQHRVVKIGDCKKGGQPKWGWIFYGVVSLSARSSLGLRSHHSLAARFWQICFWFGGCGSGNCILASWFRFHESSVLTSPRELSWSISVRQIHFSSKKVWYFLSSKHFDENEFDESIENVPPDSFAKCVPFWRANLTSQSLLQASVGFTSRFTLRTSSFDSHWCLSTGVYD